MVTSPVFWVQASPKLGCGYGMAQGYAIERSIAVDWEKALWKRERALQTCNYVLKHTYLPFGEKNPSLRKL